MSGATTELNLATAVDSDDNADYLTLSLANSLRTVDGLFNNITGHTHGGAHQGGPVTVGTAGITDGSVTLAKLAANSVDTTKIVDGTIATADLAANAATALAGVVAGTTSNPSTTSATPVDVPEMTVTWTGIANEFFVALYVCGGSVAGAGGNGIQTLIFNGAGIPTLATQRVEQVVGSIALMHAANAVVGSNTIKAQYWATAGTYTLQATYRQLIVVRFKR